MAVAVVGCLLGVCGAGEAVKRSLASRSSEGECVSRACAIKSTSKGVGWGVDIMERSRSKVGLEGRKTKEM